MAAACQSGSHHRRDSGDSLKPTDLCSVEEIYGEEVAIEIGIAKDPDMREWTDEDFARARPAAVAIPELVKRWNRGQAKKKTPV